MSDTDSDDETEGTIDLSISNPRMPTLKPYSLELLGSPKSLHVAETVPVLGTSQDPDEQQKEKVDSPHSKTKLIILVPKKRPYDVPSVTRAEEQATRVIRYIPTAAITDPSLDNSGFIGNKLPQQPHVNPDKPGVKSVSRAVKKQHQGASTSKSKASASKLASSKASTPEVPASKLPTPLASRSKASTSEALTSKASTSKASTSKASTSEALASKASTSKASTSKASTSKASTSKASTSKASTSKASTSKASTSKASTSKASTSKASTSKASTSKASTSTASTSKASTSKASTSKASTSKASTSRASTSKASTIVSTLADSDDVASFWCRTAKTKFGSNEFREYLLKNNFCERTAESLQKVLQQVARKLTNMTNNSDRMPKTHKCNNCEFTITHHCVCIFFLPIPIPITDPPEVIQAQETVICICNFAFFHAHDVDSSRAEGVNIASVEPEQQSPRRKSNIAAIRCSACDTMLLIQHPKIKVEHTLIQWSAVESDNEQKFHASITAHLQRLSVAPLTLGEMFMCTNKCCLFFHRCGE